MSKLKADEDIHSFDPPPNHVDDHHVATKKKPNDEIRIGPITRARAKLIEQQMNSLLVEHVVFFNESFILPKSLHVCMVRYDKYAEEPKAEGGAKEPQSTCSAPRAHRAYASVQSKLAIYTRALILCLRATLWAEARVPFRLGV